MNCSINAAETASVIERSISLLRAQLLARLHDDGVSFHSVSLLSLARELGEHVGALNDPIAAETSGRLIDLLSNAFEAEASGHFAQLHNALDLLAMIEERLLMAQGNLSPTVSDIDHLFEQSFVVANSETVGEGTGGHTKENIDLDLLDIFREEAEDLLRNIDSCVNALAADTENQDALWEIRRHAHTFKGSAAIVGFTHLSKRAHAIEDLIEAFVNQRAESRFSSLFRLKNSAYDLRTASVAALGSNNTADGLAIIESQKLKGPVFPVSSPTDANQSIGGTHSGVEPLNTEAKDTILRVSTSKLDRLEAQILDLELSRREIERESKQIQTRCEQLNAEFANVSNVRVQLAEIGNDLLKMQDRSAGDVPKVSILRAEIDGLRLVEFGTIKGRLERTARVTAEETDKRVELNLENESVLIDADILARLTEPLLHLIRNAVVHGLESPDTRRFHGKKETGTIFVSYLRSETHIDVFVRDDGSGIDQGKLLKKATETGIAAENDLNKLSDPELQSLIFEVGLSTADSLTMNAGRGVGMSIVKRGVDSLGGTIRLNSIMHTGTEFRLRIPLLKPTIHSHLYRTGRTVFAVPSELVVSLSQNDDLFVEVKAEKGIGKITIDELLGTGELLKESRKSKLEQTPGIIGYGFETTDLPIPIIDVDHVLVHGLPFPNPSDLRENNNKNSEMGTVLVVDDSPSARAKNVKILDRQGFNVVAVSEGIEALNWLAKFDTPPVLLVTDIEMPEMDGFELIRGVRAMPRYASLPIIIVSSRTDDEQKALASKLGVEALLGKPVNDAELIAVIDAMMATNFEPTVEVY